MGICNIGRTSENVEDGLLNATRHGLTSLIVELATIEDGKVTDALVLRASSIRL